MEQRSGRGRPLAAHWFLALPMIVATLSAAIPTATAHLTRSVLSDEGPAASPAEQGEGNTRHTYTRIELTGTSRSQLPLFVEDENICRRKCAEQKDCVAWMFRATQLRCQTFIGRLIFDTCDTHDCFVGLMDDRLEDVASLIDEIDAINKVPAERYRGLGLTCKEKRRYRSVSAVLSACGAVLRQCSPSDRTVESVPLPSVKCVSDEMLVDTNMYYGDFNNGFDDIVLSAESCCRLCMEKRQCLAWTRTASGQCWMKQWQPPEEHHEPIVGDVSGMRPKLDVTCGQRFRGVTYENDNKDNQDKRTNITDADACCELCTDRHQCYVWSYFPANQTCVLNLALNGVKTEHPNVTTAFMVTVPQKCEEPAANNDPVTRLEIALAYAPDCSAILQFGPGEHRSTCRHLQDANKIFDQHYERILRVI